MIIPALAAGVGLAVGDSRVLPNTRLGFTMAGLVLFLSLRSQLNFSLLHSSSVSLQTRLLGVGRGQTQETLSFVPSSVYMYFFILLK
jgi:hypothetical protein